MISHCVLGTADLTVLSLFRLVFCFSFLYLFILIRIVGLCFICVVNLQIIDSFTDSVMSVCLTKTEIIGGSVDGTVRTFDIRMGRYVAIW